MRIARSINGNIQLIANSYHLTLPADRPFIYLDLPGGERLAELFVLSSVHSSLGLDDTPKIGQWDISDAVEEVILSMKASSSVWEGKTYRFFCHEDRFSYGITVQGKGQITNACYFGGYASHQVRWGSGFFSSAQNFQRGFNPEPNSDEANNFGPAENSQIDMMGVPLPGKGDWFFTPPPFCFGFQFGETWLGLGVEAEAGAYRFTEYNYHGKRDSFHLSLSYEGHTNVDGAYELPYLGFDFGSDEFSVLQSHVAHVRGLIGSIPSIHQKPDWWSEPIFCGWGAQCSAASPDAATAPEYSRQALYNEFLCTLEERGIHPGIVVLDDKWQETYGENRVDTRKWPDLKGFIREQHHKGRKVVLWLKAWDPEGVPAEECITNTAGLPISVDPTNIDFENRLRGAIFALLSSDGFDADGFKIDFTARIPSGPGIRTARDLWGLELMRRYLEIIYSESKGIKPDALIMAHTPHPYLADLVDMIRLNDMNKEQDINQAMRLRAKVASIACPDAIIDTDNWPVPNKLAWRKYLNLQVELGVPSLYYSGVIDATLEPLDPEDYQLIREVWSAHRSRC